MNNEELLESLEAAAKKAKEGMQESGKDKFANEKKLQTKVNPMGIRNDKEPADVPLDIDELSYSKKSKQKFLQVPPNQPAVYDANTAENKMAKEKKHDMNRIEQIHNAWKEVKAEAEKKKKEEQKKYDINRVEQIKTTRADEETSPQEVVEKAVKMGVSSLTSTHKLLMELLSALNTDNIECLAQPWIQNKITLANDYVLSIHDYVMFHDKYGDNEEEEKNEPEELSKTPKSDSYFGNFDGHDGHSYSGSEPNVKVKKDKSDYEGGNF